MQSMNMKPVAQEDFLGCGLACVAFILRVPYQTIYHYIPNGKEKAGYQGFTCRELVEILQQHGRIYTVHHRKSIKQAFPKGTIVFLKRSKQYPAGHFLCLGDTGWMNSWINFPDLHVKAGFHKELPGEIQYYIEPENITNY